MASNGERLPMRLRRPRSGDLFFVIVLFGLVLTVFLVSPNQFLGVATHPTTGIVLIALVIQYLVLKSMDRTRVYRMENRKLRERHRDQVRLLRRAKEVIETRLRELEAELGDTPGGEERAERSPWESEARKVVRGIEPFV